MFVLVTDYTLRKIMSANDQGIVAVTGRTHCQRQVAFFSFGGKGIKAGLDGHSFELAHLTLNKSWD